MTSLQTVLAFSWLATLSIVVDGGWNPSLWMTNVEPIRPRFELDADAVMTTERVAKPTVRGRPTPAVGTTTLVRKKVHMDAWWCTDPNGEVIRGLDANGDGFCDDSDETKRRTFVSARLADGAGVDARRLGLTDDR